MLWSVPTQEWQLTNIEEKLDEKLLIVFADAIVYPANKTVINETEI